MKKFKFIFFAVLTVVAVTGFSSCSDDDDKTSENSVVGLWGIGSYLNGTTYENAIQFNSDGTGTYFDDYPDTTNGFDTFTYTYDSKSGILTWIWDDEDVAPQYRTNIWTIKSITSTTIVFEEDGFQDSLHRLK